MLKIEFDEKSVFTYDAKNLTIHAWDHRDGKWEGPVIGMIGSIKFCDEWQAYHFQEMIELMLEQIKERKNGNSN